MLSILFVTFAGVLTHVGVRHAQGSSRIVLFGFALGSLAAAIHLSSVAGGFWSGVYTLLALYFTVCMATPWFALFWRNRRAA